MDDKTKNRIREFLETVIESHRGENYPSSELEREVLIGAVASDFKVTIYLAQSLLEEMLWKRNNG